MSELNELAENSSKDINLINLYEKFNNNDIESKKLIKILDSSYPNEWLLRFEIFKKHFQSKEDWILSIKNFLINFNKYTDLNRAIQRGLDIIETPQ